MDIKRVAIVTGGTRGMGQAISLKLAKDGNIVIALYRSNETKADETKAKLVMISPQSDVFKCDVTDEKHVLEVVQNVAAKFGRIDILVNNAGIF